MSHELIFDTLQYANKLKAAGVSAQQAEIHAGAIAELMDERLATKQDIKELELRMGQKMKELELRMIIKLGGIVISSMSLLVILMKLFKL